MWPHRHLFSRSSWQDLSNTLRAARRSIFGRSKLINRRSSQSFLLLLRIYVICARRYVRLICRQSSRARAFLFGSYRCLDQLRCEPSNRPGRSIVHRRALRRGLRCQFRSRLSVRSGNGLDRLREKSPWGLHCTLACKVVGLYALTFRLVSSLSTFHRLGSESSVRFRRRFHGFRQELSTWWIRIRHDVRL